MKPLILFFCSFFLFASAVAAQSSSQLTPLENLQLDGYLALCDRSSFFVFYKDGRFRSFPNGLCGRTLDGTWTSEGKDPLRLTVTAKMGWKNGMQPANEYRKIVFWIYEGNAVPQPSGSFGAVSKVYDGRFLIKEFTKIPGSAPSRN